MQPEPYSKSEGSYEGVAFSADDISNLRGLEVQDYVKLVEAGTKRFGLVIADETKAKEFFKNNNKAAIQKSWNYYYENQTLKSSGTYVDNIKCGQWSYYNENGQLNVVATHVNGIVHGYV